MSTTKRRKVILVSVLAGLFLLIIAGIICFDAIVTRTVNKRLQAELQADKRFDASFKSIVVLVGSRTVEVRDITFRMPAADTAQGIKPAVDLHVDRVSIRQINLSRLMKEKYLEIGKIVIDEPSVALNLPIAKMEQKEEAGQKPSPLTGVKVDKIDIDNCSMQLTDAATKLQLSLEDLSLDACDIGYDLATSTLSYNDSVYDISLSNLDFISPDGLYRLCMESLETKDAGAVVLKQLRCYNTVKKTELADRLGKVPATWIDVSLSKISTSPVNLVRLALSGEIDLDHMDIQGSKAHIFRDIRYPPKFPSPMPQEELMAMPMPMRIRTVHMAVPKIDIEMCMLGLESGVIGVENVKGTVSNITNHKGESMHAKMHAALAHGGEGELTASFKMDKASHFDMAANFHDVKAASFNTFLHPLFGMEAEFTINELTTSYSGDHICANGTFCMTYDDIQARVIKDDTPYSVIAKNADAINVFAPAVLQRRNPRMPGQKPQSYEVTKTRDEMQNAAVYLTGPLLDGVLKTLLPGLVVKIIDQQIDKKADKKGDKNADKKAAKQKK